jgi:hypothetical protein
VFQLEGLLVLGVVLAGIVAVAPGYALAAIPLLVLAVCPISMGLMMLLMSRGGRGAREASCHQPAPAAEDELRASLERRLEAARFEALELERQLRQRELLAPPASAATAPPPDPRRALEEPPSRERAPAGSS